MFPPFSLNISRVQDRRKKEVTRSGSRKFQCAHPTWHFGSGRSARWTEVVAQAGLVTALYDRSWIQFADGEFEGIELQESNAGGAVDTG